MPLDLTDLFLDDYQSLEQENRQLREELNRRPDISSTPKFPSNAGETESLFTEIQALKDVVATLKSEAATLVSRLDESRRSKERVESELTAAKQAKTDAETQLKQTRQELVSTQSQAVSRQHRLEELERAGGKKPAASFEDAFPSQFQELERLRNEVLLLKSQAQNSNLGGQYTQPQDSSFSDAQELSDLRERVLAYELKFGFM